MTQKLKKKKRKKEKKKFISLALSLAICSHHRLGPLPRKLDRTKKKKKKNKKGKADSLMNRKLPTVPNQTNAHCPPLITPIPFARGMLNHGYRSLTLVHNLLTAVGHVFLATSLFLPIQRLRWFTAREKG